MIFARVKYVGVCTLYSQQRKCTVLLEAFEKWAHLCTVVLHTYTYDYRLVRIMYKSRILVTTLLHVHPMYPHAYRIQVQANCLRGRLLSAFSA